MKLFLEVTQDELSLPLAVADGVAELGQIRGISENTIRTGLRRFRLGLNKREYPRFIVVEVEDDE